MSAVVDIERNRKPTKKPFFSLKTSLILLGSLTALVFVVFATYRYAWPSESSLQLNNLPDGNLNEQNQEQDQEDLLPSNPDNLNPSLLRFQFGRKIFELDPSNPDLQSTLLLDANDELTSNFQVSKDKKHVYYCDDYGSINEIDVETKLKIDLNLPYQTGLHFLLRKPDLDWIVYAAQFDDQTSFIRLLNLKQKSQKFDYTHKCKNNALPHILDQFSDGSKLLYRCYGPDREVFLKDLNNPRKEDVKIFDLPSSHSFFLSPDDSKAILYEPGYNLNGMIVDISDPLTPSTEIVTLPRYLLNIEAVSFSNDHKKLYMVVYTNGRNPLFTLSTINFEDLLTDRCVNYTLSFNRNDIRDILFDVGPNETDSHRWFA